MIHHERWELVFTDSTNTDIVYRMVVPGGWLYRTEMSGRNVMSTAFVPNLDEVSQRLYRAIRDCQSTMA